MRKFILIIFFASISFLIYAKDKKGSKKKLLETYYTNFDFLLDKRTEILQLNTFSKNDIKDIIAFKQNRLSYIVEIQDSVEQRRLLIEESEDLEMFIANYSNKEFVSDYLESNLRDYALYKENIENIQSKYGLESCPKCALARKVEFVVLNVVDNVVDTLRCRNIKYTKVGFRDRVLSVTECNSFPCSKTMDLSLTGTYGKNIIEVVDNQNRYRTEFVLKAGVSEDDIYIVAIILDKKLLVND